MKINAVLQFLACVGALAQTSVTFESIQWSNCTDLKVGDVPAECGTLKVPLDYTNRNTGQTLDLAVLRVRTQHKPSKGSVIFNFGGPGEGGRETLAGAPGSFFKLTGGQYDLVTFDPRGTGGSMPFTCFNSKKEQSAAILENPDIWHDTLTSIFTSTDASNTAPGRIWAIGKAVADQCYKEHGDVGSLIGTAFVVRDMMAIVDALEEDGMLKFWGASYGTLLGATAAAMFPHRIGKMVLDGNLIPEDYYGGRQESQIVDSDKVFSHFFEACLKSPKNCALSTDNSTADGLEQQVWNLLEDVKYHPRIFNGTLIDYNRVKNGILNAMYAPDKWPGLAAGLHHLINGNLTGFAEAWAPVDGRTTGDINMAVLGIRCSDRYPRSDSFKKFGEAIKDQVKVSRLMGSAQSLFDAACSQWRTEAKERYEGSFQVETKFPVLVIGNTGDFITPLPSARNVSESLQGSVLLHHNGYGHGSTAQASACTMNATAAYYTNGTLPKKGSVCEPIYPLFEQPDSD